MNLKRGSALFLSGALALCLLTPLGGAAQLPPAAPSAPVAVSFRDTAGHWAEAAINRWSAYGVVKGDQSGAFRPNADLTRGEMATILVGLLGLSAKAENTYTDLTSGEWYADAILACTAAGILRGDGVRCNASDPVSRQESAVMLSRALAIPPAVEELSAYTDGADVADWAAPNVSAMVQAGILRGVSGDSLAPRANINRASVMTILDKAVSHYLNTAGTYDRLTGGGIVLVTAPDVLLQGCSLSGSLLLGAGVGDGSFTLDSSSVGGDMTVCGGGRGRVQLRGSCLVNRIVLPAPEDGGCLVIDGGSSVKSIWVADGKGESRSEESARACQALSDLCSRLLPENYTPDSWADYLSAAALGAATPPEQEAKRKALDAALDALVLTPAVQSQVDALSATMQRYFEGQNDSALHAITLHIDTQSRRIQVCVFQPDILLALALQGSGMKTAFTDPPVLNITAQNGAHATLLTAEDKRDALGAALTLADAIGTQYGIDPYSGTLSDLLSRPAALGDMRVLLGCGTPASHSTATEYHALYTLRFSLSPLRLQESSCTLAPDDSRPLTALTALPGALRWTSSRPCVATVDQNGLVTAHAKGSTTISLSAEDYSGFPAQADITVE